MLLINQRIIDSCFFKFERRVRHNTRLKKKNQVSSIAFKENKLLTNNHKNNRLQR
jgi:hypothetical protein